MKSTSSHRSFSQTHARFRPSITNPLTHRQRRSQCSVKHSRFFIDRDRPLVARIHRQRQPLQPDPPKRIIDDERRHLAPVPTVPKPGRETDAVRPVAVPALGDVQHDLAHELARVAAPHDRAEHGILHLCAEALFELRTAGGEVARRDEGLDPGVVPEVHQVVEIGLGVGTEEETRGGEHGGRGDVATVSETISVTGVALLSYGIGGLRPRS